MTVSELIELLGKHDPTRLVVIEVDGRPVAADDEVIPVSLAIAGERYDCVVLAAATTEESEGYRIPPVGERFRLVRDVERFPHFIAPEGCTGTVVAIDRGVICGKMDQPIPDCEEWDNCIQWDSHPDSDPRYDQDVEVLR